MRFANIVKVKNRISKVEIANKAQNNHSRNCNHPGISGISQFIKVSNWLAPNHMSPAKSNMLINNGIATYDLSSGRKISLKPCRKYKIPAKGLLMFLMVQVYNPCICSGDCPWLLL